MSAGDASAADPVQRELEGLLALDRPALVARWAACFGCPAPRGVRVELLRQALAWQLQARALGGLSSSEARALRGVRSPRVAPGARLVRVWQGQTYPGECR